MKKRTQKIITGPGITPPAETTQPSDFFLEALFVNGSVRVKCGVCGLTHVCLDTSASDSPKADPLTGQLLPRDDQATSVNSCYDREELIDFLEFGALRDGEPIMARHLTDLAEKLVQGVAIDETVKPIQYILHFDDETIAWGQINGVTYVEGCCAPATLASLERLFCEQAQLIARYFERLTQERLSRAEMESFVADRIGAEVLHLFPEAD